MRTMTMTSIGDRSFATTLDAAADMPHDRSVHPELRALPAAPRLVGCVFL